MDVDAIMEFLHQATNDQLIKLLGLVSVEAQARANLVAPQDVQMYRAWLKVRDTTLAGVESVMRVKATANMPKKFCVGCGDNHPVGGCP